MSQHYHAESEEGVNKQINLELYAMYTYVSMVGLRTLHASGYFTYTILPQSAYFEREDAALPGFAKYFAKASDERMEHAKKWMKFQNVRRGHILLRDIRKPASNSWRRGKEAIQAALELEIAINQALLDLHKIADKHADFHVRDCLGIILPKH